MHAPTAVCVGCDRGGGGRDGGAGGGAAATRARTFQLPAPEEFREGSWSGHHFGPTVQDIQYTSRLLAGKRVKRAILFVVVF